MFSRFQSETATLKKIVNDFAGDETVSASYSIFVDPDFSNKRIFTDENEEITGQSTVVTSSTLQADFDITHKKWKIEYKGYDYQVRQFTPRYDLNGNNRLDHVEVVLT